MNKRVLKFMDATGQILIVSITKDTTIHEEIECKGYTGVLVSSYMSSWIISNINGRVEMLLDIPPDDEVTDIFRGRYLIVRTGGSSFSVAGTNVISNSVYYLYDTVNNCRVSGNVYGELSERQLGEWIPVNDTKMKNIITGAFIESKIFSEYNLVDTVNIGNIGEEINGDPLTKQNYGSPILSNSPIMSGVTRTGVLYIMKQKKATTDTYQVLFGGSNIGNKLHVVLKFQGKYIHANSKYIMYDNKIVEYGNSSKAVLFENTLVNNGVIFKLYDAYFSSLEVVSLRYKSSGTETMTLLLRKSLV